MYEKDTLKVYDRVCEGNICEAGRVVIEIEDNVRLSVSAVYAALALSHKHGDYNRYVPIIWMIIARG